MIKPSTQVRLYLITILAFAVFADRNETAHHASPALPGKTNIEKTADSAQWKPTAGPGRMTVYTFLHSGPYLFTGTDDAGVFRSTNNGDSWAPANTGLTEDTITAFAASGTTIFAGTTSGVFRSTNNGDSWTPANTGLTSRDIDVMAVSGTTIFVGASGGVFRSSNNGDSWTSVSTGISGGGVDAMAVSGTTIFAGTFGGGVFRSTNNGDSWTPVNTGLTDLRAFALVVSGTNTFVGTGGGGVFLSTNNGDSWAPVNNGLTNLFAGPFAVIGTDVFVGTDNGVFRTTNNGESWSPVSTGLLSRVIWGIAAIGTTLFVGTYDGAFRSIDNGDSWTEVNAGLTRLAVYSFAAIGNNVFAGTNEVGRTSSGQVLLGGVYVTNNNGESWRATNNGLTSPFVRALAVSGTTIFAGTSDKGVFRSVNNGENWTPVNTGLASQEIDALVISGTTLFAKAGFNVYRSTDNGENWTRADTGLTGAVVTLGASNNAVFAGTNPQGSGIFRTTDNGQSWRKVYSPSPPSPDAGIVSITATGTRVLAATFGGGVILSTDNGENWKAINTGLTSPRVLSVAINGGTFYAGTQGGGVFLSTNQGASWAPVNNGLTNLNIASLAVIGTKLFAGTGRSGAGAGGNGAFVSDNLTNIVASVSAASFSAAELATESITAAFGSGLATNIANATTIPLPVELGGTIVQVTDSAGVTRSSPLFSVGPSQVNYQIPEGTAAGPAGLTVTNLSGRSSFGTALIANLAPGLFSANANGMGAALGVVLRVKADGTRSYEPVARFDPALNRVVTLPIDLGPDSDQVFLIFFGTGFRFRSGLSGVAVTLGGTDAQVLYAGAQGQLVGLDQINTRAPRSLAGRGEVDMELRVDAKTANKVVVNFK